MASAYKCDWCKRLIAKRYEGMVMPAKRFEYVGSYWPLDICISCGKKFEKFLEEVTLDDEEEV